MIVNCQDIYRSLNRPHYGCNSIIHGIGMTALAANRDQITKM
jgi:hypothetical protein